MSTEGAITAAWMAAIAISNADWIEARA